MLVLLTELLQEPKRMPNGYEVLSKYLSTKQMNGPRFTRFFKGRALSVGKACQKKECLRKALKNRKPDDSVAHFL